MKIEAKVISDKPAYTKREKTDTGYVWRYDEKHLALRWDEKKKKLKKLEKDIKKLRKVYSKDLASDDLRTKAIAAIVGMMDETAMRVGNIESAVDADTYGATTLRVKHLKIKGNKVTFDFPGKGAVEQNVELTNAKIISVLKELIKGKKPNDFVFEIDGKRIWDRAINRYLSPFGVSAKDLRGFRANVLMKEMLSKKDNFEEALNEVADIVGHKASTLKNQYLDPDLVKKHTKKAALSIRADNYKQVEQSDIGGPELQSVHFKDFGDNRDISQDNKKQIDLNKNISNILSQKSPQGTEQIKISPNVALAWRVVAPFLPTGAYLSSGFRSEKDQAEIIINNWHKKWNGYFAKNFPTRGKTIEDMQKFMNEEYNPSNPTIPHGGPSKSDVSVASPGGSKHQSGDALDIVGIDFKYAEQIIEWINRHLSDFVNFTPLNEGDHLHVSINKLVYPGPKNMFNTLKKYYYGDNESKIYVSQSYMPALSKRAVLSNDDMVFFRNKMKEVYNVSIPKQQIVTDKASKQMQQLRISQNVKINKLILDAWRTLIPFLPNSAMLTSGERTSQDQIRIINKLWTRAGAGDYYPNIRDPYQMANILTSEFGYVVGPPTSDKPRSHLKGNAFDISGANLDEIANIVKIVSKKLPVKLFPQIERNNNAVHVGIESAQYNPEMIAKVIRDTNSRAAGLEDYIVKSGIKEDLLNSNAPTEVVDAFDSLDIGFGKPDLPGDWFEKSPIFRHRKEVPEYEIHDVNSPEHIAKNDPEAFFYKGLHKEFPNLEMDALESMLENNAKFYFIFKYHERSDNNFLSLLQKAAEKLSQQDARAFFYFSLHHKFPELGRGAIVQIIDSNPDSFFDLGLDKDFPDYTESANASRNIKDPNKVELELDQLDQLANK